MKDSSNKKLPSWSKMDRKDKHTLLESIRQEALKLKLPVNRSSNDWFLNHLIYEPWRNKSKYNNKKEKGSGKKESFVISFTLLYYFLYNYCTLNKNYTK